MRAPLTRVLAFSGAAAAHLLPRQTAAPTTTTAASSTPEVAAISDCHYHATTLFCLAGETEYQVKTTATQTTSPPAQFTSCHRHGSDMFCLDAGGEDVEIEPLDGHADNQSEPKEESNHGHTIGSGQRKCHFHAGVEHCIGGGETEESGSSCVAVHRDYNVPLRIGLLFVILASSALGVYGPIFLQWALPRRLSTVFLVLKQFGTGIVISTAFIHLYTHATLMFANKCLGELSYESTTSAILMAGLLLSFVVEYAGHRVVLSRTRASNRLTESEKASAVLSTEVVSILVMEAGILFHSLLIGLTLVVAGDSFITLFVVILFHQVFEGIALGTRIAAIGTAAPEHFHAGYDIGNETDRSAKRPIVDGMPASDHDEVDASAAPPTPLPAHEVAMLSLAKKLGLAALFALVTPLGMAIGLAVLHRFNGNDKSTLIAIGTLDALSAGILVWVGVVEMWAADWMVGSHGHKAELAEANLLTVSLAGFGLVAGMALMSLLGKWA